TLAAAAQGWLRGRAPDGRVVPTGWASAALVLSRIQALFLGGRDVDVAAPATVEWYQRVPVGVITAGRLGALLFVNGERYEVARPVTTGAGGARDERGDAAGPDHGRLGERGGDARRLADGDGRLGGAAHLGAGPDLGRRDLLRHRHRDRSRVAEGGGRARRPGVLAPGAGLLRLLRPHAGEHGRRDPAREPRECVRAGGGRSDGLQEGSVGHDGTDRACRRRRTMKIFLDTANVSELREGVAIGVVDGCTTNPSLIAKEKRPFRPLVEEICSIVPGDVSLEVVATDVEGMVKEGRELAQIAPNVVVKCPLTKDGLKAVKRLTGEGLRVNQTLCFSATQALLSAKAGAFYISPFLGRLDDIAHVGMDLIRDIVEIYRNYGFKTQVLAASIRSPLHVVDAAKAGAHVATLPFAVLEQLMKHPLTDIGLKKFLDDWNKAGEK